MINNKGSDTDNNRDEETMKDTNKYVFVIITYLLYKYV